MKELHIPCDVLPKPLIDWINTQVNRAEDIWKTECVGYINIYWDEDRGEWRGVVVYPQSEEI